LDACPDVVEAIHREYVEAGADIVVADTFRTGPRALRAAGMFARGEELNRTAVALARRAAEPANASNQSKSLAPGDKIPGRCASRDDDIMIATSVAPVEDCYSPRLTPDESELDAEHALVMEWLAAAEPDLIWIETIGTVREARSAARAAANAGLPLTVSLATREDGDLLSGEPIEAAIDAVTPFKPLAVGVNCIPPAGVTALLPRLREAADLPLIAYAHINNAKPTPGWSYSQQATPAEYAEHVRRWLDLGAAIVGGCCGTTPWHIWAVRDLLDRHT
jgi:methionine synthase I (cobalamin-dependent)